MIVGKVSGVIFSFGLFVLLFGFLYAEKFQKKRRKGEHTFANLFEQDLDLFKQALKNQDSVPKINNISLEEARDLGRSFRRYLQKIVLNNADVDIPFIPSSVKQNLSLLVKKSKLKIDSTEDRIDHFSEEIGKWFDNSIERAAGVYKRNAKGISILIGFLLAIITNANSIYILDRLAYDRELRQALVSESDRLISRETAVLNKEQIELLEDALKDVNLPIGWDPALLARQIDCELKPKQAISAWGNLFDSCIKPMPKFKGSRSYFIPTSLFVMFLTSGKIHVALVFILGWLLTGIAISMGATFWFDLLGKVINVRNTGGKPISSNQLTRTNNDS